MRPTLSLGRHGAQGAAGGPFDLVTDLRMPEMDGIALVERLNAEHPGSRANAHGSIDDAVKALRLGASDFLMKPCSPETLSMVTIASPRPRSSCVRTSTCATSSRGMDGEDFIAKSPITKAVFESAGRIANSEGTVPSLVRAAAAKSVSLSSSTSAHPARTDPSSA